MPTGKKLKNRSASLQDILFMLGIILLTSVLIIALYPGRLEAGLVDENFFITTIMTIPVIAGIYFIVISFRRTLNIETKDIRESIKKKMTVSFVFIAVLSAMPIVIVSSTYFGRSLARMYSNTTMRALDESVNIAHDMYIKMGDDTRAELESLRLFFRNGSVFPSDLWIDRMITAGEERGNKLIFFRPDLAERRIRESHVKNFEINTGKLIGFYNTVPVNGVRVDRLAIDGTDFMSGAFRFDRMLVVLCKPIPDAIKANDELFRKARNDYIDIKTRSEYFESGAGSFLMLLSIVIIGIAYIISLYISGNITHPVMELSSAAKQIAMGNNRLVVKKRSDDEIGTLVDSFNMMARKLEENRKFMFQKQKLEAWNEMARKLVHEIKNPLTPIRLAAERMRKLVIEGNPSRDEAVMKGSETIVSEVSALLKLVSNFNSFARLPEKKAELSSITNVISDAVALFQVYDKVKFEIKCENRVPEILLDRALMRQALNNLISNSVHAMHEEGIIRIICELDREEQFLLLRIIDNGPGIKAEHIEKVFDPGFTLGKNGTGLGLAIVEKIVLEHNGKIFCKSEEGKGAEFIIMLPVN